MSLADQSPLDYCPNPMTVREMMKGQKRLKKVKTTEAFVANCHPDAHYPYDQSQSYQEIHRVGQELGLKKVDQALIRKWVTKFYKDTGHKELIKRRVAQLETPTGLDRVQDSVDMWYGRAYIRSASVMSAYLDSIWLHESGRIIAHLKAFLTPPIPKKANGNAAGAPAELDPLSDLGTLFRRPTGDTIPAVFDPFDPTGFNHTPTHVFDGSNDLLDLQQSSLDSDWSFDMNFQ